MFVFEHEKLDVYHVSREFNREVCRLMKIAGKGHYDHIDNLIRAGASMPRNIGEAGGEWSPKEKAKFFRYAKRSAAECAATLDALVDYDMLRGQDITHAKELLGRIIPMLVRLAKIFEEGRPATGNVTSTEKRAEAGAKSGTGTGARPQPDTRARARDP